ncbi:MAG: phage holin family protein [Vicingaceae bacterium]|jgi:ABC-type multidrug transport system fused ATPase/permease subunit
MIKSEEINNLLQESKDYLDTELEIRKLEATEKLSLHGSNMFICIILGSFGLLFLIFSGLFLGFILSEYFSNFSTGFGIIALAYLLIFAVLYVFRRQLIGKPIQNKIIRELYSDE